MATEPRPTTATATTRAASPTVPLMAQPRIDVVFIVASLCYSAHRSTDSFLDCRFWIVGSSDYFIRSRHIGHEVLRRIIIGDGERRGPGLGGARGLGGERCRKEGLEDALRAGRLGDDPVADAVDPHVGRLRERAGGVASPLRAALRVEVPEITSVGMSLCTRVRWDTGPLGTFQTRHSSASNGSWGALRKTEVGKRGNSCRPARRMAPGDP